MFNNIDNRQRLLILILLGLIIVTIPLHFKLGNIILVLFTVVSFIVGLKNPITPDRKDLFLFLPALLFVVYVFGLLWSDDLKEGWLQIEKRLMLISFPISFYLIKDRIKPKDIVSIMYLFVSLCMALSIICYVNAFLNVVENQSLKVVGNLEREYFYFSYLPFTRIVGIPPIYLSLFVNFSIIILLCYPLRRPGLTIFVILYFTIFILLISSKIGILGLLLILVIGGIYRIRNKFTAIITFLSVSLIFYLAINNLNFLKTRFIVQTNFAYDLPYAGDWNSVSQRLAIWSCALKAIEEKFPIGYGTASGQVALNKVYRERNYIRGYEDQYNAHNEFLYAQLDIGIFGTLVLILMVGLPLAKAIREKYKALIYFGAVIFLYFLVEVVLARRFGIQFYSFFYCLLTINITRIENGKTDTLNPSLT